MVRYCESVLRGGGRICGKVGHDLCLQVESLCFFFDKVIRLSIFFFVYFCNCSGFQV